MLLVSPAHPFGRSLSNAFAAGHRSLLSYHGMGVDVKQIETKESHG
jgi:hypothetical protein